MTLLESLHHEAFEKDIHIVNTHFSPTKKGACLHLDAMKAIILDKPAIVSTQEEIAILAEELGHYETGSLYFIESTYHTPVARNNRRKCEHMAKRWAVHHVVSPENIQAAIQKGLNSYSDIADDCQVPLDFLQAALQYYAQEGISFQIQAEFLGA